MTTYVSRRVNIEAVQFTGSNWTELEDFCGANFRQKESDATAGEVYDFLHETWVTVFRNQWVIKGTQGEFYPCDPDVFTAKYEPLGPVVEWTQMGSSEDAILRGAERIWGSAAGHGGVVTSSLPQRGPQHEK